ncbi:hypothetical protein Q5P01_016092 [Channa striata]|uniref:Selectin E n=1 Tax=Channa striata TaxID=64152 RepID=A0AA88MDI0_CHASR|nr:hypothetical protein Q5P01_016092 [Channa striata]
MVFGFELFQTRGSKITSSWISWALLYSMLCMWASVESWSYHYSNTTMNWEEARNWCKQHYTDMVAIQNKEEIGHLNSWLPKQSTYYWIGIRKINNVWTWVGTNKPLTKEATNWAQNEPNNGKNDQSVGQQEDCVEMYIKREKETGKWNDERCGKQKTALCYTAACKVDSCVHGECVETINSHKCDCFEGFYGEKCEQVVKCNKEEVTVPDNGSVNCTDTYGEFSYNSSCEYSCEKGYQLSNSTPLRCTASEKWSLQPPSCELVQCPELSQPTRGSMTCSDPLGPTSYQSTCVFTCDEGHVLTGSLSSTVQCEASGNWNTSQPSCAAVQCPALQELENGLVSCGEDPEMRFTYGNTCTFSCAPSYRLVGPTQATCTSAAEWNQKMPHCEAITCQKPEEEAQLIMNCNDSLTELRPDSTCSFSCKAGFNLQGANTILCTGDGQWSTAIPTCEVVQCPKLSQPTRGSMICSDPLGPTSYQSTCVFTCDEGHVLTGSLSSTVQCEASGNWNTSQPSCAAVQCPALQELENGFVSCAEDPEMRFTYGNTCTFSCAPSYRLVGPTQATCTSAAEWSQKMPHCEAITCQKPEEEPQLIMNCSDSFAELRPDSTCSFSCKAGFNLQGANTILCTEDGQWSTAIPTCEAISCLILEAPENGNMNCSNHAPVYNSQCSFACNQGYLLEGHELLTCDQHGNWTGERPTCKAPLSQTVKIASGLAAGSALLSSLSVAMWLLKRLKQKATKFELNSNSYVDVPTEVYKSSIDSLI